MSPIRTTIANTYTQTRAETIPHHHQYQYHHHAPLFINVPTSFCADTPGNLLSRVDLFKEAASNKKKKKKQRRNASR